MFRSLAIILVGACAGAPVAPVAPATPAPAPAPAPQPPSEPEPLAEAPEEPEDPPPSMESVALAAEVTLGCDRFILNLPASQRTENEEVDPAEGEEDPSRIQSGSCVLGSHILGAGWAGASGTAHLIIGECDIYLTMREELVAPEMDAEPFAHPSGASIGYHARNGFLVKESGVGTHFWLEAGADRESCVGTMSTVIRAAAQTLHAPPMPEDRVATIPLSGQGHNATITIPEGHVLIYTGRRDGEYDFSWQLRSVDGTDHVRIFGYFPGEAYEHPPETIHRGRALGAARRFSASGGDFIEAEARGIATIRSSDRRAEVLLSIGPEETEGRTVLLEALGTMRFGRVVRAPRNAQRTNLPQTPDGMPP